LGYDIDTHARRLVVNPEEAHQVSTIFNLYIELGGLVPVLQELDRRGWRTKRWTTEAGQTRGGKPFTKSLLYGVLTNAIYTGQVNHKGTLYPGEHEAIIEQTAWDRVQDMLERNGRANGVGSRNKYAALLRGLIFCVPCNAPMLHVYTAKGAKRYRYYVCYQAQQRGWKNCKTKSVSAPVIEGAVLDAIRRLGSDKQLATEVVRQAREQVRRRREEHARDVGVAENTLRRLNAEMVHLAGDGSVNSTTRVDRLVDLQGEIQAAEQHLAELAAEGRELEADHINEADALRALAEFDPVWQSMTSREQIRLIHMLVAKVGYDGRTGKVAVEFRSAGTKGLCKGEVASQS
jgi:site-specific DNA recombinase